MSDEFDEISEAIDALNDDVAGAGVILAEFRNEVGRLQSAVQATGKDLQTLEKGLSRGLRKAFDGVFLDGMKASDALRTVARSMIETTYSAAITPVTDQLGGVLADGIGAVTRGMFAFEKGGSFAQGRVMPFAKGGVVSGATAFPMRGATGLMGEAGPEAIMPLSRGADGSLGVRMQDGGRPVTVVMNIQTPDVQGFQRSQGQIAAQLSRALMRGNRNR